MNDCALTGVHGGGSRAHRDRRQRLADDQIYRAGRAEPAFIGDRDQESVISRLREGAVVFLAALLVLTVNIGTAAPAGRLVTDQV